MMEYSYYPGCSLRSTGLEFHESVTAVFRALGIGLFELEDWNCCGASSAHSLDRDLSLALPARNLSLAQAAARDVVMPCAACYNRHKTAEHELQVNADRRRQLEQAVGFKYQGSVTVRALIEVLHDAVGLPAIREHVTRNLAGLPVVAYYGCLLIRPPEVTHFDDPENPVEMGRLLSALGAEVRPWGYATECCGGALSLTQPKVASRLVSRLADRAREAGAQAIVTSCPLCQVNLEMRQRRHGGRMPIFYISELMGVAFGLEESRLWWSRHLVDPRPVLRATGLMA
jgi:heterodisulfide reductase subunit B